MRSRTCVIDTPVKSASVTVASDDVRSCVCTCILACLYVFACMYIGPNCRCVRFGTWVLEEVYIVECLGDIKRQTSVVAV